MSKLLNPEKPAIEFTIKYTVPAEDVLEGTSDFLDQLRSNGDVAITRVKAINPKKERKLKNREPIVDEQ